MQQRYPELDIEYYTCDTGKELDETYQLISNLEVYLGKPIKLLQAAENSTQDPFDHFFDDVRRLFCPRPTRGGVPRN